MEMVACDQNTLSERLRKDDLPTFPTLSARHVFSALASFACRNSCCWPSKSKLASVTGLSIRTVDAAIKALDADGFVKIVSRGGSFNGERKANKYTLFLPASQEGQHPRNVKQAPPQSATSTPAISDTHPRNRRHPPPQPLRGKSEEKSEERSPTPKPPERVGQIDRSIFNSFRDSGGDVMDELTEEEFRRAMVAGGLGRAMRWRLREAAEYLGGVMYANEEPIRHPVSWLGSVLRSWAERNPTPPGPGATIEEVKDYFDRILHAGPPPGEDDEIAWENEILAQRDMKIRVVRERAMAQKEACNEAGNGEQSHRH